MSLPNRFGTMFRRPLTMFAIWPRKTTFSVAAPAPIVPGSHNTIIATSTRAKDLYRLPQNNSGKGAVAQIASDMSRRKSCGGFADAGARAAVKMSYDLTESATYLSSLLAKEFSRSLLARSKSLGFLPGQFPVLCALWKDDGLTQREILNRLGVEQATLANTLARMERDGLIDRRPHGTDRRATRNFLTEKARAMESDAVAVARAADDALFRGFRRFEKELMLEYIRWAIKNAEMR